MRRHGSLRQIKKVSISLDALHSSSILVLGIVLVVLFIRVPLTQIKEPAKKIKEENTTQVSLFNRDVFQDLSLKAKAYIVYDIVGKEIIASSHVEDRLPLASLTKVMTSLTALSLNVNKNELFKIESSSIEDGYDLGLKKNQVWKLEELLKYMMIFSSNDAALTVAAHYGTQGEFVKAMNNLSSVYGLSSVFTDPAGRDIGTDIGGLGTVLDAAKLFILAKTSAPDILDATTKKRQSVYPLSGKLTGVPNTNQDIENLSGAEGSKTGYTDLAGGNLGVIVDLTIGRPVVIVVLGSTRDGRFHDVEVLYKKLEQSLKPLPTKERE